MFMKFGDVPFYIVKVEKETNVYDLSTPEIEVKWSSKGEIQMMDDRKKIVRI